MIGTITMSFADRDSLDLAKNALEQAGCINIVITEHAVTDPRDHPYTLTVDCPDWIAKATTPPLSGLLDESAIAITRQEQEKEEK